MADRSEPTENQALVRLAFLVIVILLALWVYDRARPETHHISNTPSAVSNDLKVDQSDSSAGNLQQSSSPITNSSSVQTGQGDLQPAQNSSQLPDALRQELGL